MIKVVYINKDLFFYFLISKILLIVYNVGFLDGNG